MSLENQASRRSAVRVEGEPQATTEAMSRLQAIVDMDPFELKLLRVSRRIVTTERGFRCSLD